MALNLEIDGHLVMLILMIIFKLCDDWLWKIFINKTIFFKYIFVRLVYNTSIWNNRSLFTLLVEMYRNPFYFKALSAMI